MQNIRLCNPRYFVYFFLLLIFILIPGLSSAEDDASSREFIDIRDYDPMFVTKQSHRITREIDRWFLLTATGEDNNTLIDREEVEVAPYTRPVEDIPDGPYYWRTTKAFPMESTMSWMLTEFDLWDDYTDMTRSMDKITRRDLSNVRIYDNRPPPFRLPVVTDILRHPSSCATISRMMGDDFTGAVEGDEAWMSCGIPQTLEYLGKFGNTKEEIEKGYEDFKEQVNSILEKTELHHGRVPFIYVTVVAGRADALVAEATEHLTEDDREFITENAREMIRWGDDSSIEALHDMSGDALSDELVAKNEKRQRFFQLADSIDLVKMGVAGCLLASLKDDDLRDRFMQSVNDVPSFYHSPNIVTGGIGETMYYTRTGQSITLEHQPTMVIDLGNDITYRGTQGGTAPMNISPQYDADKRIEGEKNEAGFEDEYQRRNISLVLDFGGDDTYIADDIAQGCGLLGVSVVIDFEGDDIYIGGYGCQGAGILGIGALIDLDGNDRYIADGFAQGAALCGIGILLDESRSDTEIASDKYEIGGMGQGFGFTGGFGMLYDRHGSDIYTAGWKHGNDNLPGRGWDSMAQGFGWGMHPGVNNVGADGGIGLLIDRRGHDNYLGDQFCQGSSYWYALGVLIDDEGDDHYMCGAYSQGSGALMSAAALIDGAGNDMYTSYNSYAQGSGHDWATGMLIDRGGDDRYYSHGTGQGSAGTVSFGMLIDLGGDDHYNANYPLSAQASGDFHTGRSEPCFGIFFDLGEGDDWYADERLTDGIIAHKQHHGLFLDDGSPVDEE